MFQKNRRKRCEVLSISFYLRNSKLLNGVMSEHACNRFLKICVFSHCVVNQ